MCYYFVGKDRYLFENNKSEFTTDELYNQTCKNFVKYNGCLLFTFLL